MNLFQRFHPLTKRWGWAGGLGTLWRPYSAIHLRPAAPTILSPKEEPGPLIDHHQGENPHVKRQIEKNGIASSATDTVTSVFVWQDVKIPESGLESQIENTIVRKWNAEVFGQSGERNL